MILSTLAQVVDPGGSVTYGTCSHRNVDIVTNRHNAAAAPDVVNGGDAMVMKGAT
jgi:hypothetical protein